MTFDTAGLCRRGPNSHLGGCAAHVSWGGLTIELLRKSAHKLGSGWADGVVERGARPRVRDLTEGQGPFIMPRPAMLLAQAPPPEGAELSPCACSTCGGAHCKDTLPLRKSKANRARKVARGGDGMDVDASTCTDLDAELCVVKTIKNVVPSTT